jgi:hypothetical protein
MKILAMRQLDVAGNSVEEVSLPTHALGALTVWVPIGRGSRLLMWSAAEQTAGCLADEKRMDRSNRKAT